MERVKAYTIIGLLATAHLLRLVSQERVYTRKVRAITHLLSYQELQP